MIIVVEIVSRAGTRACKEYDAPSYNAAIEAVNVNFAHTPRFALQTSGSKTIAWSSENQWTTGDSVDRQKETAGVGLFEAAFFPRPRNEDTAMPSTSTFYAGVLRPPTISVVIDRFAPNSAARPARRW